MTTSPTCIIAYVREGEKYAGVERAAMEAAESSHARLILYDADAASLFGEPLPTWWSGEGSRELFHKRLSPNELETAGRHEIAERVREARTRGLDAYGWLPSSRGAEAFEEYAAEQDADMLILPSDMEEPGLLDRLRGTPTTEAVAREAERPVIVVDIDEAA